MRQIWKIYEHVTEEHPERTMQRKKAAALVRKLLGA
jgi:hypothetical protein